MAIIKRDTTIVLKGATAMLSDPLIFYVNDKIRLSFTIQGYSNEITERGMAKRVLRTVHPVSGQLCVETPLGVDSVNEMSVEDSAIIFELDNKFTGCAGTYKAQIILTSDEDYQTALPPFSFIVLPTINEDLDGRTWEEVTLAISDKGECILTDTNEVVVFK